MKKILVFILVLSLLIGCAPIGNKEKDPTAESTIESLPQFQGVEYFDDGTLGIYTPPSAEIFFVIDASTIWLEIDISDQTLFVHRGDETLSMFSISSGKFSTPTPTGSYKIYKMQAENTTWLKNVSYDTPWTMFFHHDYAIHSANWHDNFGQPVSQGCINMREDEAKEIYNQVELDTHVYIHE